jgi:hypothetical protein
MTRYYLSQAAFTIATVHFHGKKLMVIVCQEYTAFCEQNCTGMQQVANMDLHACPATTGAVLGLSCHAFRQQ